MSILLLVLYAVFGSSHPRAVGSVAIVPLLVANTIAEFGATDRAIGLSVALGLAVFSGVILIALGLARLGSRCLLWQRGLRDAEARREVGRQPNLWLHRALLRSDKQVNDGIG